MSKTNRDTYLVVVESPTKAKTIRKFLPKNYIVEASMGHVRDLPQSAADIPQKLKKEEWTKLGVNVEKDFEPLYIIPKGKSKIIQDLKRKCENAQILYLATDEDREGESISWHLFNVLKPKIPVKRMVFHEITKSAIEKALQQVRDIDLSLVRAQETRRILDRLVGYTLSPLIWKKIAYGLSAGRVQSAGLRLIVERERERLRFQKGVYWDIEAELSHANETFTAKLFTVDGTRIASGKDFDEITGKIAEGKAVALIDEKQARKLCTTLANEKWVVQSVEEKDFTQRPSPPFITSTLQQEANRKLGLSARETMRIAQRLYEEGLITYMRTDSPNLSEEAIQAARKEVVNLYGSDYLSPEPRQFSSKSKGAQEAHEAIRPAGSQFTHPKDTGLSGKDLALYELIWMRTMATQMAEAKKSSMSVRIQAGPTSFSATGTRILFPGFLRAYFEGSDDPEASLENKEVRLPPMKVGDVVQLVDLKPLEHETKPPARYTEASLVQALEKEGIGRPSTYATIIDTIQERGYVKKQGNALIPTFTGFAVIQLLENHFHQLVDYGFTSQMENTLDEIAEGKVDYLPYLKQFYLGKNGLAEQVKQKEKIIDPETSRTVLLTHVPGIHVKIGRYGAYLIKENPHTPKKDTAKKGKKEESSELHASIPEDVAPADLNEEKIKEILEAAARGPQSIGKDPKSGKNVYVLSGRFGPYVQLGEVTEAEPKPRRASIPKLEDPKNITLERALQLLSLPRDLGPHPETGKMIQANIGRFGPYVVHENDYRSLKKDDDVYTISLERALELLKEEKKIRRGAQAIREVGKHPKDEKIIQIYDGKYGMYIKHGDLNATLPDTIKPEDLTLEQAVAILKEREEQVSAKSVKKTKKRS
jgi:DNA topoisomerase-1